MLLVDDLLMLPFRGFLGLFKRIAEMAEKEVSTEDSVLSELMELHLRFELDEIPEEEYERLEKELMARLEELSKDDDKEAWI